jgi:hypothetical protein
MAFRVKFHSRRGSFHPTESEQISTCFIGGRAAVSPHLLSRLGDQGMENQKSSSSSPMIIVGVVILVLLTLCCCGGLFCGGGTTYFQQQDGKGAPPVQAIPK